MNVDADKFFRQLTVLVEKDSSMTNAVENIKKDWQSKDQPHGNIKPPVTVSISRKCDSYPEDETGHLEETITAHQSINIPGFYQTVSTPGGEPLRRAVSLSVFLHHHINESFRGRNLLGKSYDRRTSIPKFKRHLLERFKNDQVELELDELSGSTGPPGKPTWWTFYDKYCDAPGSGEAYMKELALDDKQLESAEIDNVVMEVIIYPEMLGQDLFKPTALDAFEPETKFEPELTGKAYGYTSPREPALQSRPEVVSASIPYRDLRKNTPVTVKKYPYKIYQ